MTDAQDLAFPPSRSGKRTALIEARSKTSSCAFGAEPQELLLELDPALEFDAGQFAVLRVPHIAGYRGYSMVDHPGSTTQAKFVVKRKPDGAFTEWLFSSAKPGDCVEWFGPLGKAIFTPQEQRTIVCIAGGSGIASIMSILEAGSASRHFDHFEAAIFFGVRTNADAFYLDRLQRFAETFPDT